MAPITSGIPEVDLTCYVDDAATDEARAAAAAALDETAERVGFFYLKLPGLSEAAERLLERCQEFHSQPAFVKSAVSSELSPLRRGYNATWQSGGGS